MKYILHIDTSTDAGSVLLSADNSIVSERNNTIARNHAASINNMIEEVLFDAGVTLSDLNAIAVCGGPGSYTGLRIGLATAKGICFALDIPLMLHNKLVLLAYQALQSDGTFTLYASVIKARESEFFYSVFNSKFIQHCDPRHGSNDEFYRQVLKLDDVCMIGDEHDMPEWVQDCKNIHVMSSQGIETKWWCFYSFDQYNCNNFVNLSTAEPFYLKQVYTHK